MAEAIHRPEQVLERAHILNERIGGIVVGSAVPYLAFGKTHEPHDVDIAVSEEALSALENQPDWELTTVEGSNRPRLVHKDGLDVAVGWGDISYETLHERSWQMGGVMLAHPADVYAWKQRRNDPEKDQPDLETMRELINGIGSSPLPSKLTVHEQKFIANILPDEVQNSPELQTAIELAASGLCGVRIVYGDMTRDQVNHIIGEKEKPEYGTLAAYHEGGIHTPNGMRWLMRHMSNVNAADRKAGRTVTFTAADFLDGLIAYAYHDARFGNGREVDEAQSARLAQAHALAAGYIQGNALANISAGIEGTSYNDITGKQSGINDTNPLVLGMCGADLQGMSEASEVRRAYDIVVENSMAGQREPVTGRVIGKAVLAHGLRIFSPRELYEFIDNHPELKRSALRELGRDLTFISPGEHTSHRYHPSWTGQSDEIRLAHADELWRHMCAIANGSMTFVEGYDEAARHTERMYERYPRLAETAA